MEEAAGKLGREGEQRTTREKRGKEEKARELRLRGEADKSNLEMHLTWTSQPPC